MSPTLLSVVNMLYHAINIYQLYQTFLYKPNGALHAGDFHRDAGNMALGFDVGG